MRNKTNIRQVLLILVVLTCQSLSNRAHADETAAFVPIFDGKTFAGWKGDIVKTWRIQDGAIAAGSHKKAAPHNDFLTTTEQYANFELRLKFKISTDDDVPPADRKLNAGVQFRSQRVPNHHEVSGFQADISPEYDGHLYDESRRRRFMAQPSAELMKQAQDAVGKDGWHSYRIRAEGQRIQLWLNGVRTVDFTESDESIDRTGLIALQIHGGMRATVAYKDIAIQIFADTP